PKDRHAILAELIDLSRFQRLHEKVDGWRRREAARVDLLEKDIRRMPEISEEELRAARDAVAALAEEFRASQELGQVLRTLKQLVEQGAKLKEHGERVLALGRAIAQITPQREQAAARLEEL